MTTDLLVTAILIISIATMSAAMGMMFSAFMSPRREEERSTWQSDKGDRNDFPGQRRGGGTHAAPPDQASKRDEFPDGRSPGTAPGWIATQSQRDQLAKGNRDEFPGRRQGSGGGDNGGSPPAG